MAVSSATTARLVLGYVARCACGTGRGLSDDLLQEQVAKLWSGFGDRYAGGARPNSWTTPMQDEYHWPSVTTEPTPVGHIPIFG